MRFGQRVFPDKFGFLRLPEGGYGRDIKGKWWWRPPGAHMSPLRLHEVVEHEDGTISTLTEHHAAGEGLSYWLEGGEWQTA